MNRLRQLLERRNNNLLAVYFTAGYPDLESTAGIIEALSNGGIDIIEIGVPFSDPMADGVVIQQSSQRAISNGITLKKILSQVEEVRKKVVATPFIAMGYINPMMQYGMERFFRDASRAGIDGVIIPDLPFEMYMSEVKSVAEKYDLCVIMLITPETSEERIKLIDQNSSGFIYMVSSASTTGARNEFNEDQQAYFKRVNEMNLSHPRMIGFGISNPATYSLALQYASGAIVGSKFISLLQEEPTPEDAVSRLKRTLGRLS